MSCVLAVPHRAPRNLLWGIIPGAQWGGGLEFCTNGWLSNHCAVPGPPLYVVPNSSFSSVKGGLCKLEKERSFQRELEESKGNLAKKSSGGELVPRVSFSEGRKGRFRKDLLCEVENTKQGSEGLGGRLREEVATEE